MDVIKRKGTVLQCHKDMAEMVTLSEIGMSKAILEAGYNLDSLMLRYQVSFIGCIISSNLAVRNLVLQICVRDRHVHCDPRSRLRLDLLMLHYQVSWRLSFIVPKKK